MRVLCFLIVLTGLLCHPFARADRDDFPVPPSSASRLFYIQRSNNTNTVIYDANMLADKKLDPHKPVSVYWIRYAEKGQQEGLSFFQWKMAYGYKHRPLNGADGFEFSLNAFDKRPIHITSEHWPCHRHNADQWPSGAAAQGVCPDCSRHPPDSRCAVYRAVWRRCRR